MLTYIAAVLLIGGLAAAWHREDAGYFIVPAIVACMLLGRC